MMPPAAQPTRNQDVREQAVEWLLKREDGPLGDDDRRAFEAWLAADPAHADAYARAHRLFGESSDALKADPDDTRDAIRRTGGGGALMPVLLLAGLLVFGGLFLWADGPIRLQADARSGHDESPVVQLADGSSVQLDADSALAVDFEDGRRTVRLLKGQAWFDVAPDPDRPFVVESGDERIVVVGTVFDVNRTADETEVTVAEGRVQVRTADGADVILSPQMRARVADGELGPVEEVPGGMEGTWRSGRLVFEDRPLGWVVANLARHLPERVVIADAAIAERRFTGTLDLTDPETALADLAAALDLRTARAGGILTVVY